MLGRSQCAKSGFFLFGGGGGGGGGGPGPTAGKQSGQRFFCLFFLYSLTYFTVNRGSPMVLLQRKL